MAGISRILNTAAHLRETNTMHKIGLLLIGAGIIFALGFFITFESLSHTFPAKFTQEQFPRDLITKEEAAVGVRIGISRFYKLTKIVYIPFVFVACGGILIAARNNGSGPSEGMIRRPR